MKALKKYKSLILKLPILVLNLNFNIFFFKKRVLVYDTETSKYYENFFDKNKTFFILIDCIVLIQKSIFSFLFGH